MADGAFYEPHGARQRVLDGVRQERWKPFAVAEGCGAQDGPELLAHEVPVADVAGSQGSDAPVRQPRRHASETVINGHYSTRVETGSDGGEHTPNRALDIGGLVYTLRQALDATRQPAAVHSRRPRTCLVTRTVSE